MRHVLVTKYTSDDEDVNENGAGIFFSTTIPWESRKFKKYKQLLDEFVQKKSTKKGVQLVNHQKMQLLLRLKKTMIG